MEANREESVRVLTMRHRQSGAIFTTVVLRKGAWPYAVAAAANFILKTKQFEVELRGDAEHALIAFLQEVAASLRKRGIDATVQQAPVGSHQSILGEQRSPTTL